MWSTLSSKLASCPRSCHVPTIQETFLHLNIKENYLVKSTMLTFHFVEHWRANNYVKYYWNNEALYGTKYSQKTFPPKMWRPLLVSMVPSTADAGGKNTIFKTSHFFRKCILDKVTDWNGISTECIVPLLHGRWWTFPSTCSPLGWNMMRELGGLGYTQIHARNESNEADISWD